MNEMTGAPTGAPVAILGGRPCKAIINGDLQNTADDIGHLILAMIFASISGSVEALTAKELEVIKEHAGPLREVCCAATARIEGQLPG